MARSSANLRFRSQVLLQLLLFAALLFMTPVHGLSPVLSYPNPPTILGEDSNLFYTVDVAADTITLAIIVNDTVLKSTSPGGAWIGIGFGEQTSGSMTGSDIVTAEFPASSSASITEDCMITDRYVPFASYPLREAPGPFPFPDDCAEPDWDLVSCAHDTVVGSIKLEVRRKLSVVDDVQDRAVLPGAMPFLHAWGSGSIMSYHGTRRQSTRINFYSDPGTDSDTTVDSTKFKIPADADGSFVIAATNYSVPTADTTYACTSVVVPLEGNGERMIVAAEPLVYDPMVHHFTLFSCGGEEYAEAVARTVACDGSESDLLSGPLGNSAAGCTVQVYAWAKGIDALAFPDGVGVSITAANRFLVMETHYDNPAGVAGVRDASGIRVHYTNTPRTHRASSLILGDAFVSLRGDVIETGREYQFSCPTACTQQFSEPVNVFSSFQHMHTTGRTIVSNVYSANGTFVRQLNAASFWSDSFQQTTQFDTPIVLQPGEQVQTTCTYDTSKLPGTKFGLATKDEMCMDFLMYWPAQTDLETGHDINICSAEYLTQRPNGATMCFDGARSDEYFSDPTAFPYAENPAFNDTVGAPEPFASDADATCAPNTTLTPNPTTEPTSTPDPTSISNPTTAPTTTQTATSTPSSVGTPSDTSDPSTDSTPSPGDNDGEEEENEQLCFPASATVVLDDGRVKRMDEVVVGDRVRVQVSVSDSRRPAEYSDVFMFTHADASARHTFVRMETDNDLVLVVTAGHYVYANGRLVKARNVAVGDWVYTDDERGTHAMVTKKDRVTERGLYNPQTRDGNVVVNGILTSTFTEAVKPVAATALLAPLRWAFTASGVDTSTLVL